MIWRIVGTFSAAMVVGFLLLGWALTSEAENVVRGEVEASIGEMSTASARTLQREFDSVRRSLISWSQLPLLKDAVLVDDADGVLPELFEHLTRDYPMIESVAVFSGAGLQLLPVENSSRQRHPWLTSAQAAAGVVPAPSHPGDLAIAHAVGPANSTEARGVVRVAISSTAIEGWLEEMTGQAHRRGMTSTRLAMIEAGAIVYGDKRAKSGSVIPGLQKLSEQTVVHRDIEAFGARGVLASSLLTWGTRRLGVVAFRSEVEALDTIRQLFSRIALVAFLVWLGTVGLGYLLVRRLARPIREFVETVQAESRVMTQSSHETSASTTQQATSIRETGTTIQELKASLEQTKAVAERLVVRAEASLVAGEEGETAAGEAREGMARLAAQVAQVNETILGLSAKMGQIGAILSAVNDLAEQSKFLALNAAIEAARAGEHGRGFGVVSVEVRNLAQQSQEATAQIERMIQEISAAMAEAREAAAHGETEASQGLQVVGKAEASLVSLREVMVSSREGAEQILASLNQQHLGMEQITMAMDQIDEGVLSTVAAAERTAEVSEKLQAVSEDLGTIVGGG